MKKHLIQAVKAVQNGGSQAFAPLYEEFKQPIYFRAVNIVGEAEAENIVQETFITAFQRIRDLTNPETFPSWLNKIALGKCADFLKKQDPKPEPDNAGFIEPDGLVPDNVGPETARIVYEVIQQLPLPQRACVYFYYYERLTIPEIAEELAAGEDAVKARLAAAREAIQKALEEQDDDGLTLYLASPLLLIPIMKIAAQNTALPPILAGTTATTIISTAGTASTVTASTAGTAATATSSTAGTAATATKAAFSAKAVAAAVLGAVVVTGGIIAAVVLANPETEPTMAEEETRRPRNEEVTEDTEIPALPTITTAASTTAAAQAVTLELDFSKQGITDEKLAEMVADGTIPKNVTKLILNENLISDISPLQSLNNLIFLGIQDNRISDITPLKGLTNIEQLYLRNNLIQDISPLKGMLKLRSTGLDQNQIRDISPLKELTNLTELWLYKNQISDISPLENMTNLTNLELWDNKINDISPLKGLTNMKWVWLGDNPINESQLNALRMALPNCEVHIDYY